MTPVGEGKGKTIAACGRSASCPEQRYRQQRGRCKVESRRIGTHEEADGFGRWHHAVFSRIFCAEYRRRSPHGEGVPMRTSKPDCRHYLAEDLCAALPLRPEEHCCDDREGNCTRYVSIEPMLSGPDQRKETGQE